MTGKLFVLYLDVDEISSVQSFLSLLLSLGREF